VCNVTRPLFTNLVACNVTRNEPSLGLYPDQALVDSLCNVTRGSAMLSVPADQLAVSVACNATRHLVYVSHFQPASAEVIYVNRVMAQTITACNVKRDSATLNVPADQLAVSIACNVTRSLARRHTQRKQASFTWTCNVTQISQPLCFSERLTIRCIKNETPPSGINKLTDRPHTRPPRNRGFFLRTQKSNFARLSRPGSDGRSAFGGWK